MNLVFSPPSLLMSSRKEDHAAESSPWPACGKGPYQAYLVTAVARADRRRASRSPTRGQTASAQAELGEP
jgi:hypothetical protein